MNPTPSQPERPEHNPLGLPEMDEFRFLRLGESFQKGDEYWHPHAKQWMESVNYIVIDGPKLSENDFTYRRRVASDRAIEAGRTIADSRIGSATRTPAPEAVAGEQENRMGCTKCGGRFAQSGGEIDRSGDSSEWCPLCGASDEFIIECDCEDYERGLVSNECPIHNENPRPKPDCAPTPPVEADKDDEPEGEDCDHADTCGFCRARKSMLADKDAEIAKLRARLDSLESALNGRLGVCPGKDELLIAIQEYIASEDALPDWFDTEDYSLSKSVESLARKAVKFDTMESDLTTARATIALLERQNKIVVDANNKSSATIAEREKRIETLVDLMKKAEAVFPIFTGKYLTQQEHDKVNALGNALVALAHAAEGKEGDK